MVHIGTVNHCIHLYSTLQYRAGALLESACGFMVHIGTVYQSICLYSTLQYLNVSPISVYLTISQCISYFCIPIMVLYNAGITCALQRAHWRVHVDSWYIMVLIGTVCHCIHLYSTLQYLIFCIPIMVLYNAGITWVRSPESAARFRRAHWRAHVGSWYNMLHMMLQKRLQNQKTK